MKSFDLPLFFKREFDLEVVNNDMLIIEMEIPSIHEYPNTKSIKYIKSTKEFKETIYSKSQIAKIYENHIYGMIIKIVYEMFKIDFLELFKSIVFNGWTKITNPATGTKSNSFILSLCANRTEFINIELESIEPKKCFKHFKGVSSSTLQDLVPISPVINIDKNDKRFVAEKNVVDRIDSNYNLAMMEWQDFEHLIREVFEKEFKENGGEVAITQSSRDGGVDAIAFDPDPIRGGKIVIQAKRYNNTVGVSAVRDLYGTILNEGANKGILVTTADFGPDAYSFAKGKPITLLNGGHILFLLQKHNYNFRIDIEEAKNLIKNIPRP